MYGIVKLIHVYYTQQNQNVSLSVEDEIVLWISVEQFLRQTVLLW